VSIPVVHAAIGEDPWVAAGRNVLHQIRRL